MPPWAGPTIPKIPTCSGRPLRTPSWSWRPREGERLLGILRCVGDGASVVFLQDLLVYPERQRQGVGSALFRTMLGRFPTVYQLELLTDATGKTDAFYRAQGLLPAEEIGCRAYIRM